MELAFSERSLRQLCESKVTAERKLGAKIGERLRRRVADLHAAAHAKDLVTGQPHKVENDQYTVRVVDGWSISQHFPSITQPKLLAVIKHLGVQEDEECFKLIAVGQQKYKRYSQKALARLREAIPTLDIEEIWHSSKGK